MSPGGLSRSQLDTIKSLAVQGLMARGIKDASTFSNEQTGAVAVQYNLVGTSSTDTLEASARQVVDGQLGFHA